MSLIAERQTITYHLACRADAPGLAVAPAERAQVGHDALLPEERVEVAAVIRPPRMYLADSHHLPAGVDVEIKAFAKN